MRFTCRVLALVLAALLLGLMPVAYADPPDPSWLGGYWDDDDFDSTVVFIAGACAVAVDGPATAEPLPRLASRIQSADAVTRPAPARISFSPRAPPLVDSNPH